MSIIIAWLLKLLSSCHFGMLWGSSNPSSFKLWSAKVQKRRFCKNAKMAARGSIRLWNFSVKKQKSLIFASHWRCEIFGSSDIKKGWVRASVESAVWVLNFEWGEHISLIFFGNFFSINQLAILMVHLTKISAPYDVSAISQSPKTLAGRILSPPVKCKPIYYPWGIGLIRPKESQGWI